MVFQRRILHHGPDPAGAPQLLSLSALRSCWFELQRQGGCGAGELVLADDFEQRDQIELGDWVSFEAAAGDRWYLGRVEERSAEVPAQIRYRLAGMTVELNQVFPGGFGLGADGQRPHRYAATDLFPYDPDYAQETFDFAGTVDTVVRLLMTQYVIRSSHIQYATTQVESPSISSPIITLKVRGEESVRSVLKDLAMRAQSAAWGVDAEGKFFFLRPRTTLLATYREQRDLTTLSETRDFEFLFNRLLLTGDYVYDQQQASADVARKVYRWRGNYFEPASRGRYGERRLKLWLPWVRTQNDSLAFAREFFRTYSQPTSRYFIETTSQTMLPRPWLGVISLQSHAGTELVRSRIETIRVLFDHAPRFRMELGPEDPRTLWPEPPQDERWELPNQVLSAGGPVSHLPPLPPGPGGGGGENGTSSGSPSSSNDISSSVADSSEHSSNESSTDLSSPIDSSGETWPSSSLPISSIRLSSLASSSEASSAASSEIPSHGGGGSDPEWPLQSEQPDSSSENQHSSDAMSSAVSSSGSSTPLTGTYTYDDYH